MENYNTKMKHINNCIDTVITNPLKNTHPFIYDILRYALAGGKRLRSVITLTVGEALNSTINIDNSSNDIMLLILRYINNLIFSEGI